MTEHTVGAVSANLKVIGFALDAGEHLSKLGETFKRNKRVQTVVVTEGSSGVTTLKGKYSGRTAVLRAVSLRRVGIVSEGGMPKVEGI